MSVQKILPIARKMGEENFLAYKKYVKDVKNLKVGEQAKATLNLKNLTIIDAIYFTIRDNEKVDIEGFRNLLREIHKKYFPRAGAGETQKTVYLTTKKLTDDSNKSNLIVQTVDEKGSIGRSNYEFKKNHKKLTLALSSICEDFKMNLEAIFNLKNNEINKKQDLKINVDPRRDLLIEELGDKAVFLLKAAPTKEVSKFNMDAEIYKYKLEDMFNGGLEKDLPELIKKSGFKLDF